MSAFEVNSWDYAKAARIAHEQRPVDRRGFLSIYMATPPGRAYEAWRYFRDLYNLGAKPGRMFDSRGHTVVALLLFAAICEDEEWEEEGQL